MIKRTVAMLGGDQRDLQVVPALKAAGWRVQVFGLPQELLPQGVVYCQQVEDALRNALAVILPLPGIADTGRLYAPYCDCPYLDGSDFRTIAPNTPFVTGVCSAYLKELADSLGHTVIEVAEEDKIALLNAVPTAEGALQIAMEELPLTIEGLRVLILGYGRVGSTLASKLRALGAVVFVSNRGRGRFAAAARDGFAIYPWENLKEIAANVDLIVNTVPALVLNREVLLTLNRETLIIDLASGEGGTDFAVAKELGISAKHALSLPGRVAPVSAGRILAGFYPGFLEGLYQRRLKEEGREVNGDE